MGMDIDEELWAEDDARERARLAAERDREAWRAVMDSAHGRRAMRSIVAAADPLSCSALDPSALAYRDGQRSH